jgi:hypothetical protein
MDITLLQLQFSLVGDLSSPGGQIILMITCIVAMYEPPIPFIGAA